MSTNCTKVKTALMNAFTMTQTTVNGQTMKMSFDLPKNHQTGWHGGYWGQLSNNTAHLIMVNDTTPESEQWATIIHEAAHFAGYKADHSESWNAYSAEACAKRNNEEDDDDDDDGGGGGGGWVPGDTCTPGVEYVEVVTSCTDTDVVEQGCNPQCTPGLEVCLTTTLVPVVVKCS